MKHVLIVEDSDSKCTAIVQLLQEVKADCDLVRAATMIEAERAIAESAWDLVILDISMDIAPSRMGHRSRGQANIGGLGIAQKMFLLNREAPTIIVTAFDSFSTATTGQVDAEIVGFEEIRARASEYLPGALKACLQYNSATWKDEFRRCAAEVLV